MNTAEAKAAAKAAWVAAGSPRGAHPLFLAAMNASRADTQARNAAASGACDKLATLAASGAHAVSAAALTAKHEACIRRAFAWPRCGQGFPATRPEHAAAAWAADHGGLDAICEQLEVFS